MSKTPPTPTDPRAILALGLLAVLVIAPAVGSAQDAEKPGLLGPWKATAELSYVVTGGNTATSALTACVSPRILTRSSPAAATSTRLPVVVIHIDGAGARETGSASRSSASTRTRRSTQ